MGFATAFGPDAVAPQPSAGRGRDQRRHRNHNPSIEFVLARGEQVQHFLEYLYGTDFASKVAANALARIPGSAENPLDVDNGVAPQLSDDRSAFASCPYGV